MKNINYILIILLSILFSNFAEAQTDFTAEKLIRKGNREFADSNFTAAEEQYQLAVLQDKSNFKAKYNLANTLFKQERFEEAAEAYEEILDDTPDKTMRANIYHNMANSKLANKDLEGSIEDYKNALRLKPKMQDTRYNLSYAMKLKEQQDQQEQQENKDDNKDNKDQDKKDDKNKDNDKKDQDKKDQDKKDEDKKDQDQDKKDENSEDKNKDKKDKQDEKKPGEEKKQKVDKKETERLLRAVAEKEKETKEKLEKKKARVKAVKTEKDW